MSGQVGKSIRFTMAGVRFYEAIKEMLALPDKLCIIAIEDMTGAIKERIRVLKEVQRDELVKMCS